MRDELMPISPTVVRRQLGHRLRVERERAKLTQAQVPDNLMSKAKLMRLEAGTNSVKLADIWALCRLYGTKKEVETELTVLAEAANEVGWWEAFADVTPEWVPVYLGLETAATKITYWHPELVPGLLQTEEYARTVIAAPLKPESSEHIERRVALRLTRQKNVLDRRAPPPPQMKVMLGAAALHAQVGSMETRDAQREYLIKQSHRPDIDVSVMPFDVGAHAGIAGPFILLEFDDELAPACAYAESHRGARLMESAADVTEYRRITALMEGKTVPVKEYCS
jgi:transcriptional regulator with XRE-family HTH domain